MKRIKKGNLNNLTEKYADTMKGWFAGQFIKDDELFKNDNVALKWGIHGRGEDLSTIRANTDTHSMSILISGKLRISFPDDKDSVLLENQGDYVFWDKGVFHEAEVLEDSTILTIRWPSVPYDVITK